MTCFNQIRLVASKYEFEKSLAKTVFKYYLCQMEEKQKIVFFRRKLLSWTNDNMRDFPWRNANLTNYQLIFTEIMLQRTKAETVSAYYNTFFKKYPDWESIINANIQELEEIMKPLGLYKHRAKRIYKIIKEYKAKQGQLPVNKNQLQESNLSTLYISNAYELFVLNRRSALLDVNMSRVLSRFFYINTSKDLRQDKLMQHLATKIINVKFCKQLNWGILDFAALVCKSSNPKCDECILKRKCSFYMMNNDEIF